MRTLSTIFAALFALCLATTDSKAQSVSITTAAYTNSDVNGDKGYYVVGTYTLAPNTTVDYVQAKWYLQDNMNLIWKGTVSMSASNGNYPSSGAQYALNLPRKDANGNNLVYTVIVNLYIVGNANPVANRIMAGI